MKANIVTYTGKIFNLLNPKPEQVCIEDIAHSLAYQCRYTGHTKSFYSVAQHCVLMAENSDLPGDPMAKLLHDADETYIGDIAKPWKQLLKVRTGFTFDKRLREEFETYIPIKDFELGIQDVIGLALGVNLEYSAEVKDADYRMMATEIRDLMLKMPCPEIWGIPLGTPPVKQVIVPWNPEYAKFRFLDTYRLLK